VEALRERFGKYHVLEKIAQGGMAEVYKVKTVGIAGFEKIQALKRILPSSAREGRFIRSFIDEARIAVELTHRNIVQVFDFGKADGELFMAMELIEGKDLRTALGQAMARDRPPSVPLAAYIISEVAAGLDYAHRKADGYGASLNIVHCDVSPSNVMLSIDGYVKILDFGIARASFASALERRRLRGKPRYMAPEQTLGDSPTAASDVFALGIIAWELFTGLPLYRGPDVKAILEAVRKTDAPRVDRLNAETPREIADAIALALDREPARRGTAADLGTACARAAMAASPRMLALWLHDLDEPRTEKDSIEWHPGAVPRERGADATSISAPPDADADLPPARPSVTAILANVPAPPHEIGEGSQDDSMDEATTARAPSQLPSGDPTATIVPRYDRVPHTPLPMHRHEQPTPTAPAPQAAATSQVTTDPIVVQVPVVAEDATRADVRAVGSDDTSYDELEPDVPSPAHALPADEPIDDDLGALVTGLPVERRRAVVVAGTLAGAPGDALRPITRSLGELAYQRGGVVVRLDDDGLVLAFGLEVAGEDDVAVAMGWALDACAMARDATAHPVQLRIGARTGVGTSPSPDTQGLANVPGDAIEEARTLAREATPERPLFVGAAGRLTTDLYALRELPAPRRIARRSRVIEVLGPRGFEERDRARLERRGKFIGRTQQLAELEVWLQRAIAADRRLSVLIQGAAGTGKSRLVAELVARRRAAGAPLRIVMTAATPASRLAPFSSVIDLYQAALGLPPARGRGARNALVQRLVHVLAGARVAPERARAVADDLTRALELRDGLGIGAPEVADLRPRISAGLAVFRIALALRDKPLLTVVEDIHHADSASLEVLRHALAMPAASPELLVLTTRPEGPPPPATEAVLAIGDLVGAELRALIADRLGEAATPMNIAAVLARGGGNPLFIEELAQAVRDAGAAGEEVPASARDVVLARLERLPVKAKLALRFAAVLGSTVRPRLVEELLGDERTNTGDDEVGAPSELDQLVQAGFLARVTDARGAEGELVFARGLVREVVYDSLSARAQREAHARIGRLLASRFFAGREEPPAAIAEHLERGGELAGAAAFWLRAGRLALAASDTEAAVACFTRTLAIERELGPTPPTATSRVRRREALGGREEAHRLQGDLASDPLDLDELARLCEGEPARLADVAIRRAQRMLRLGDFASASVATVVAEDHATAAGDPRLCGEALRIRGEILERLGRFDEALACVRTARDLFHRQGAIVDEMAAMVGRGRIHLLRGHYEAARDAYRPVLALIEKTRDPWLERVVANHVAVIEMCLGHFTRAMASAQRSVELCRRYGDRAREGDGLSVIGIILLEVGLYERAGEAFGEALDMLSRTGSRWSRADCLIYAGTCEMRRGRFAGIAMIDEALNEARRLGARYLEANALIARSAAHYVRETIDAAIADAAEGTALAAAATLTSYEVQGLARHALALAKKGGHTAECGALVHRALQLLDEHRYLESSEEEVFAICARVLRTAGADDRAEAVRMQGAVSALRKLEALDDPEWRAAYRAIPEIDELLR
jgi:serine/threonine protein kinase/tetratricopeptide (TPR) repeat protein